ncbi:MAG: hypothetical protein KIT72_00015 [Polyangiaceae bacterium]|nr:hypothetical protein [Polyangiaceae bacterium]MCW5788779.1 hypothetical protein [Polyangiaceae bacterium]
MTTLLVMTTGQSDVQLVKGEQRHKLDGNTCGVLHDAIAQRAWSVVDAPPTRSREVIKVPSERERKECAKNAECVKSRETFILLPDGDLQLCTPKLDAVLASFNGTQPTSALLLETTRRDGRDPWLAGGILERRLRDRGIQQVMRVAFLTGTQQLEEPSSDVDAVVRGAVVAVLSNAIGEQLKALTKDDKVFIATTGGLAAANELINELVHLHAVGGPSVVALEVPDGNRAKQDDRAVEEKFHPAAGYRARWHALSLIEKGNLLGAWGAVSHLEDAPGQEWTQVVNSLAHFASSLPLPPHCDLAVLSHSRMAVRAALRVELALRADDIPRAVHGTVAFFEAALWDWLRQRDFAGEDLASGSLAEGFTFATEPTGEKKNRFSKRRKGTKWCINDFKTGIDAWLPVLGKTNLCALWAALTDDVRNLRNDVAHNEPTPALMDDARARMQDAELWSTTGTFLSQPLVQAVLKELGEPAPESLLESLLAEVRRRLASPVSSTGGTP